MCCCFGHRDIWGSVPNFADVLERLITESSVTVFMTGGMGDFAVCFLLPLELLKENTLI